MSTLRNYSVLRGQRSKFNMLNTRRDVFWKTEKCRARREKGKRGQHFKEMRKSQDDNQAPGSPGEYRGSIR